MNLSTTMRPIVVQIYDRMPVASQIGKLARSDERFNGVHYGNLSERVCYFSNWIFKDPSERNDRSYDEYLNDTVM